MFVVEYLMFVLIENWLAQAKTDKENTNYFSFSFSWCIASHTAILLWFIVDFWLKLDTVKILLQAKI
jgi:hypothetical protein